ncbi:MAG: methionyl-tRNA formyltransferase [Oscillospiraceae bacterium]|nr:methionyl-tRNA formyltransferase [Oscillospiraceae bacterium]
MKIIFMGTPDFAQRSLEALYHYGHEVVGVFTQPDKPKSRGMKVTSSPVKDLALAHGTPVYQPVSLRDDAVIETLQSLDFDLIVVVAYGKILPTKILDMSPLGAINIHASILPKYRGAAPIQWAILNGDQVTGVTSMYMAEALDAGDIILTHDTAIGANETSGELFERLKEMGANLLNETIDLLSKGEAPRIPQDSNDATYAPMLSKDMSAIDWNTTGLHIKCKVRGLNPWPVATTLFKDKVYKIFAVDTIQKDTLAPPGALVSTGKHGIEIACLDGVVIIKDLQASGGKRMSAADHLKGNSIFN